MKSRIRRLWLTPGQKGFVYQLGALITGITLVMAVAQGIYLAHALAVVIGVPLVLMITAKVETKKER